MGRDSFSQDLYDQDDVYTGPAKDDKGHSHNIRCHIPPDWVSAIAEFINSPDWPEYKTPQDFYRDAIYHRMRWASKQPDRGRNERVRTLMAMASIQAALGHKTMIRAESQKLLEEARQAFASLAGDGNLIAVRELIKDLEYSLTDIEEPYRSQLAHEIETWERRISM